MDGHARQADPGHGTAVETAVLGSGTRSAGGGRAGAGRGADEWWLRADNGLERHWEWNGHAFGGLMVADSGDGGGGSGRQGMAEAELGGGGGRLLEL